MKKNLFYLIALVCAVSMFTACSDDDDKPIIPPADLTGTFGQDDNTELALKYGDVALTGKQVKFETADSKTATITLTDVIPGEAQTVISGVQLVPGDGEYTFSGTTGATNRATAAAAAASIEYNGAVKKGALTLNLKVTMADANGWAKSYGLGELAMGDLDYGAAKPRPNVPVAGAAYVAWSAVNAKGMDMGKMYAVTFRGILGIILPQVLKSVTLEADGNISAEYSSDAVEFQMSMINSLKPETIAELVAKKSWQQSPKNLAYWFQKGGKLYVKLNIPAIVAQATGGEGQDSALANVIATLLEGDASKIKGLLSAFGVTISDTTLNTLLDWVKNGVPLNVEVKDGHTYIYLDKAALNMLFTSTETQESDFTLLMKTFSSMIPAEYKAIVSYLNFIPTYWADTTEFSLGLDLIAK